MNELKEKKERRSYYLTPSSIALLEELATNEERKKNAIIERALALYAAK